MALNPFDPVVKRSKIESGMQTLAAPQVFNDRVQEFSPMQVNIFNPKFVTFNPASKDVLPAESYQEQPTLTKTAQVGTRYRTPYYGGTINYPNTILFAYDGDARSDKLTLLDLPTVNFMLTGSSFQNSTRQEILRTFRLIGIGESYNYGDYTHNFDYKKMKNFDSTIISYVTDGRTHIRNCWKGTILAGTYIGFTLEKVDRTSVQYELAPDIVRESLSMDREVYQFIPEVSESSRYLRKVFKDSEDDDNNEYRFFLPLALVKETFHSILTEPNTTSSYPKYGAGFIDSWVDMSYSYVKIGH